MLRTYYDEAGNKAAGTRSITPLQERILIIRLKQGWIFASHQKHHLVLPLRAFLPNAKAILMQQRHGWAPMVGSTQVSKPSAQTDYRLVNAAVNLNMKHWFQQKQDISVDLDWLHYDIHNQLYFSNSTLPSTAIF